MTTPSTAYVPTLISPSGTRTYLKFNGSQYYQTNDPLGGDHWFRNRNAGRYFSSRFKTPTKGPGGSENWSVYISRHDVEKNTWKFGFETFRELLDKGYRFSLTKIRAVVLEYDADENMPYEKLEKHL